MKWGILATGTIAKKFASTVEQMGAEGEQLVAVGSRHLESAQAFAQQYGIPRCYDSYEALAADPEVEAIYIATPNTLHYENCKLCLEQGKHVLCEKPFTISPEQAQQSTNVIPRVIAAVLPCRSGWKCTVAFPCQRVCNRSFVPSSLPSVTHTMCSLSAG